MGKYAVLERGEEFSRCRHVCTGYEMDILTKYLFTGEERFLEVLELVGSNPKTHYGRFMALRLYEITGKKKFLERFKNDMLLEKVVPRLENFRGNACNLRLKGMAWKQYDFIREDTRFRELEETLKKYAE